MEVFKKILKYTEEHKNKLYLAFGLISLSVVIGIVPYLLLYRLLRYFLETSGVQLKVAMIFQWII